jgi:glutamyl-tRNA synthetase
MVAFFFLESPVMDDVAFNKAIAADASGPLMLASAIEAFAEVEWNATSLHEMAVQLGESLGLALRKAQAPIRCAVTGSLVGPPLFESLELLGRERTLARLRDAQSRLAT